MKRESSLYNEVKTEMDKNWNFKSKPLSAWRIDSWYTFRQGFLNFDINFPVYLGFTKGKHFYKYYFENL